MAEDSGEAAMHMELDTHHNDDDDDDFFVDGKDVAPPLAHLDHNADDAELPVSTPDPAPTRAISKELQQVEVELRLLEALEIYHPAKLQGIHRHFILYGLMEYLNRRLNRHFTANEVLELLDRFYNLELLKPDDDESDILSQEEEFSLPASILAIKEDSNEES